MAQRKGVAENEGRLPERTRLDNISGIGNLDKDAPDAPCSGNSSLKAGKESRAGTPLPAAARTGVRALPAVTGALQGC